MRPSGRNATDRRRDAAAVVPQRWCRGRGRSLAAGRDVDDDVRDAAAVIVLLVAFVVLVMRWRCWRRCVGKLRRRGLRSGPATRARSRWRSLLPGFQSASPAAASEPAAAKPSIRPADVGSPGTKPAEDSGLLRRQRRRWPLAAAPMTPHSCWRSTVLDRRTSDQAGVREPRNAANLRMRSGCCVPIRKSELLAGHS